VNLRARAGERGQRIKTVPEGATLELVGVDEQADGITWRNVREPGGATGWVTARFVARTDR
jgi:SH3-like domain-containing protein